MTAYYTPSGRLAPHPNMSDDELDDYERWAKEVDGPELSWWTVIQVLGMIALLIAACVKVMTDN